MKRKLGRKAVEVAASAPPRTFTITRAKRRVKGVGEEERVSSLDCGEVRGILKSVRLTILFHDFAVTTA